MPQWIVYNTHIPILSLRSTHITIVQSTRETGDINPLKTQNNNSLSKYVIFKVQI